jgi:hypothetical protein
MSGKFTLRHNLASYGYCKLATKLPLNLIFRPRKLRLLIRRHERPMSDINNELREIVLEKASYKFRFRNKISILQLCSYIQII